jgi:hypothetical protein
VIELALEEQCPKISYTLGSFYIGNESGTVKTSLKSSISARQESSVRAGVYRRYCIGRFLADSYFSEHPKSSVYRRNEKLIQRRAGSNQRPSQYKYIDVIV